MRRWRRHRDLSQLALSGKAGVSQRHLSYLETGKARPSPEMIIHLSEAMAIPLRDRNTLLMAAGHAPYYSATGLDDESMGEVRAAIDLMLASHEPYPAFVVDHRWNLVQSNDAARRLTALLIDPASPAVTDPLNVMRLTFHPEGLRSTIVNWDELWPSLASRVRRDAAARAEDDELRRLAAEVFSYVDMPASGAPRSPGLVVPVHYRSGSIELRLFSTIATIGSPLDVTLDELAIEFLFPADGETTHALRTL